MIRYLKNLSAFRVLFWFLFAVSAIAYLILLDRPPAGAPGGGQSAIKILLDGTDGFGNQLSGQEALAVAAAARFETLAGERPANTDLDRILERTLAAAPEYVLGLAVFLDGHGDRPNRFAYRSRSPLLPDERSFPANPKADAVRTPTAREVNMERLVGWSLRVSSGGEDVGGLYTLLTVSLRCPEHSAPCGQAMLAADSSWLANVLATMEAAGARHPLCVSPDDDILWLEGGALRHDRMTGVRADVVRRAREYIDGGAHDDEFLKTDILGSGWRLLLANPVFAAGGEETSLLPLLGIVLTGLILLLEGSLAAIRGGDAGEGNASSRRAPRRAVVRQRDRERERGFLAAARRLLFQYRIANPDQARIESELRVARDIQFSLLPLSFPAYSEWRDFDLHSVLHPAKVVAGDFYDFFMPTTDRLIITVGDVSGNGFPAALYMAACRTAFRALAAQSPTPGRLLSELNDMLVRDNSSSGLYVTNVCFFVDLSTGSCQYSIAGHPAPLWHRAGDGNAVYVDEPRGTLVGMKAGIEFPTGELRLGRGDTLLLYTDGVSEARDAGGRELSYDGLRKRFLDAVGEKQCRGLIEKMDLGLKGFTGAGEQDDDITLLSFRYWGPGGQMAPPADFADRTGRGSRSNRTGNLEK